MKIPRLLPAAGILVAVAVITAGCIMAPKEGEIRYGGQYYPDEFLLFGLGDDLWSKYDINVTHTLFTSAGESNEALISGSIDINVGADTRTVSLFGAIPDQALIIGTAERGNRYSTVVKVESDYQTWEDLKGQKIGIKLGTGAEGVLRKYFSNEGLNWDDFQWVNLNVEDMIANLEQGTIEAFHAWEFTPAIAEAQGVGRVLRTYGDVALVPASIHTTRRFVEENRDLVVRFLAAHLEKADLIKNDPDRAAQIAVEAAEAKGLDVSEEAFKKVFERIDFQIEFDQSIIDAIEETAEFLKDQGKIESVPTLAWDSSLIEDAKELYEKTKES
jgi:ABC-type nitrate/sulfonate/bicarbonate transport system substrate-binding protein